VLHLHAYGTHAELTLEALLEAADQGRFFALGSILPNYGSYYGIASANDNNLPIPKSWADYISQNLDGQSIPALFTGTYDPDPSDKVTPKTEFLDHIASYEAIGVSYLVAPNGTLTAQEMQQYGIVEASVDAATTIYHLPNPASYFSTDTGCAATAPDRDVAHLDCPTPVKLRRLELLYPGWHVTIDGRAAPLQQDGLFQAVSVKINEEVARKIDPQPNPNAVAKVAGCASLRASPIVVQMLANAWSGKPRQNSTFPKNACAVT